MDMPYGGCLERGVVIKVSQDGARIASYDRPGIVTKPLKALFRKAMEAGWTVLFMEFEDGTGIILSHLNADITNGISKQDEEALAIQIIDRLHPIGSLYASVKESNPCEQLGGVWINRGSISGVADQNIVWKRIALPTFDVVDGALVINTPDYSGDSRLDACIYSVNDDGILTITMPDDLNELTFLVNEQGVLEVQF